MSSDFPIYIDPSCSIHLKTASSGISPERYCSASRIRARISFVSAGVSQLERVKTSKPFFDMMPAAQYILSVANTFSESDGSDVAIYNKEVAFNLTRGSIDTI